MTTERICVYTALFGNYERLNPQPMAGESDVDWICFTDDSQLTSDDWEVVVIEPSFALDPARSARKVKMLPPTQVRDYGISLWIDNPVWDEHPRRFLEHAREIEAIHRRDFPPSVEEWTRKFRRFRPVASARRFAQRPLLVMHGEEDDSVPVSDARQLVNAHGSAELSLFEGAGHRLRHDPRAVAVLLGWLDRMRSTRVHPSAERV